MKLNPKKCAFGMREGTFLGYKVDADGLRVSSKKVKAVIDLPSPKCLKDVQKLNGKLASLNRFLSKSAEKSLSFFKTLKKCTKKSDFQWTLEAEEAFKEMKPSIAELPMLTAPKEKEELIIYLAAAKEAISAVLMTERDGKQRFELGEHDIQYRPRTSVKGQILADFIVERLEDGTLDTPMEDREELSDPWILFTNGSSCVDGAGAGLIILESERDGVHLCSKGKSNRRKRDTIGSRRRRTHLDDFRPGKVKFLIVAIDYFTKWIEAKPVASITGTQVKKFVWDNIVCRFGLPGEVISDNGKQFRDNPFKYWCEKLNIRQCFASVKHFQANGLVKRANRSLGEGIKARLGEKNKNWVEEISHVLWAHRTMIKSSNGETPFSLTYRTEAVIPAEIGMPTLRTAEVDVDKNNKALEISLDLLEEKKRAGRNSGSKK
nr:reverse transcriptase domain-containing protein [Tanacetum cinerariifolium]